MVSRLNGSVVARPGDSHAHNRLAVGLFAIGERDAAVEALLRAAELEPSWSLPHRNLAIAHLHRGDLAAATSENERADEIDRTAIGGQPPGSR
jgi:Flp pilus assembly protein TadD